mmetsp:Transcript_11508/g.28141  ORF Transcript_11508/g.28141 Transcript_11508/m.28141 type:complete len:86 (+) Transcript_11508:821-1078(+)
MQLPAEHQSFGATLSLLGSTRLFGVIRVGGVCGGGARSGLQLTWCVVGMISLVGQSFMLEGSICYLIDCMQGTGTSGDKLSLGAC